MWYAEYTLLRHVCASLSHPEKMVCGAVGRASSQSSVRGLCFSVDDFLLGRLDRGKGTCASGSRLRVETVLLRVLLRRGFTTGGGVENCVGDQRVVSHPRNAHVK